MLRELGPDNPLFDGQVCLFAAAYFFVHGFFIDRWIGWAQRRRKFSDEMKAIGIAIMRPACFIMSAVCLLLAWMHFYGKA